MPSDLQVAALLLLEEGCEDIQRQLESGKALELGAAVRSTGKRDNSPLEETDSVIFLSAPYLHLKEGERHIPRPEDFVSMTLLQSLYGYDLGDEQDDRYITEKLDPGLSGKKIHVPQLWCLMIGSGKLSLG